MAETANEQRDEKRDDIVATGRELFGEWIGAWDANRNKYLEDLKFVWVKEAQWPKATWDARKRDRRPTLEINQMPQYVRQITNDQRQNRPSIRIRPTGGGAKEETAELYAGIIRGIEYESNAAAAYDTAFESMVTGGFGAYRVVTEYENEESFDQVIRIKRIANALCVVIDPMYNEADASDMTGAFVYEEMTRAEFKRRWPHAKPVDFTVDTEGFKYWCDGDNIIVADWYSTEYTHDTLYMLPDGKGGYTKVKKSELDEQPDGKESIAAIEKSPGVRKRKIESKKIMIRKMCGNQVLEETEWAGKYVPVVPVFGDEMNIDGEKVVQGFTRRGRDAQMMYNYWVSSATERIALSPKAPWVGYKGQFKDPKWKTANEKNWAYLETDPVLIDGKPAPLPQRNAIDAESQGILSMAQAARFDLQSSLGMYDASLGKQSNEISGRAITAREKQGDTGTFHYIDNLSRSIRYGGKIIVDVIPKIYDKQRQLRIIKEDQSEKWETVNQPNPAFAAHAAAASIAEQQQMPGPGPAPAKTLNDLTIGSFDVVVDTGPSYATKRVEAVEAMTEFMQADPTSIPYIGDLYAKEMDFPGARKFAERLRFRVPPEVLAAENSDDPKTAAAIAPLQKQLQALTQQNAQLQQQVQALSMDVTAKIATAKANETKANAAVAKVEGDRALAATKADTEHMRGEAAKQSADAKTAQNVLGALLKLIELQQTQKQSVLDEASMMANTVTGIYNDAAGVQERQMDNRDRDEEYRRAQEDREHEISAQQRLAAQQEQDFQRQQGQQAEQHATGLGQQAEQHDQSLQQSQATADQQANNAAANPGGAGGA